MPTAIEFVAGVAAIVLGAAWVIWPTRMKHLQMTVLYFGKADTSGTQTDTEALIGRVTGVVLALLGVGIVLGLAP